MIPEGYVDSATARRMLGVGPSRLDGLRAEGRLSTILIGRRRYYRRDELERYAETRGMSVPTVGPDKAREMLGLGPAAFTAWATRVVPVAVAKRRFYRVADIERTLKERTTITADAAVPRRKRSRAAGQGTTLSSTAREIISRTRAARKAIAVACAGVE